MTALPPASDLNRPTKSRGWIAFFVVIIVLAVTAATLPILYNLRQQLTSEHLEKATAQWNELGPTDYDLTFSIRYDRDQLAERHIVLVREGKASFAACEGEIVHAASALGAVLGLAGVNTQRQRPRDIPAIFRHIAELRKDQEESSGKNLLVVVFDPHDGHPRRIVRRIKGTSTREEWDLRLWLSGELAAKADKGTKP